jgi:hypothetical protein
VGIHPPPFADDENLHARLIGSDRGPQSGRA